MTTSLDSLKMHNNFNLLSWFLRYGSLAIVLITVITAFLLSESLENHLISRDSTVLKASVINIAKTHDPSDYFSSSYAQDGSELNEFFNNIEHIPDVARINAYSTDNIIVWSSDAAMVGQQFPQNHELEEALEGDFIFEKVDIKELQKPEHLLLAAGLEWFIENYIPVIDPQSNKVVGVIEIYRIPVELSKSISQSNKLVWTSVLISGFILFIFLLGIIYRGHSVLTSQQKNLIDQSRLATIGDILSSVANNIRKPLASMRSSAEHALEESPSKDISENIEDIISEMDRFDGWTKELLSYTSDAGNTNASAEISEVIKMSVSNISGRAERMDINIHTVLPDNDLIVRGDATLLVQVINSLSTNALDAMPHGGQLIIKVTSSGPVAHITLSDTGYGIPPEKLENLFDPLVMHNKDGVSIGLALAKQILQRYEGSININSTVGSGTNVTVLLPLK